MRIYLPMLLFPGLVMLPPATHGEEPTVPTRASWMPPRDPSDFPDNQRPDKYYRLIFFAVLEGLYEEGLVDSQIETLLERAGTKPAQLYRNFIFACPICEPARTAIELYQARPVLSSWKIPRAQITTFGKGPSREIQTLLESKKVGDHRTALRLLVEKWTTQKLNSMNLTEQEKSEWRTGLAERKKAGMQRLHEQQTSSFSSPEWSKVQLEAYGDEKGCSICEGAASAGEKCQIGKGGVRADH